MINTDGLTFFGVQPYIFFAGLGLFAAYAMYMFIMVKKDISLRLPSVAIFASLIGMDVGARIFGILANKIYILNTGKSVEGGFVFYGGLVGFLAVYLLMQRVTLKSFSPCLNDAAAVIIPLFHMFGRLGCFFTGCCYGICGKLPFSVLYSTPDLRPEYRIPVQLFEAGFNCLLFTSLLILLMRNKFSGKLLYMYLFSYSTARFFLEFLRGDEVRGMIGELSFAQVCSILIFTATLIAYKKAAR